MAIAKSKLTVIVLIAVIVLLLVALALAWRKKRELPEFGGGGGGASGGDDDWVVPLDEEDEPVTDENGLGDLSVIIPGIGENPFEEGLGGMITAPVKTTDTKIAKPQKQTTVGSIVGRPDKKALQVV